MINIEKVLTGLKCVDDGLVFCKECGYSTNGYGTAHCKSNCVMDAITLIEEQAKKQKPVEPTLKQDDVGIFVWACGSCGAYMYHIYDGIDKANEYAKYCRQCGKKVKWE